MKKLKKLKLCVGKTCIQTCNRKDEDCTKCEYGEGHKTVKLLSDQELVELFGKSVLYITDLENIINELSDFREQSRLGKFEKDVLPSLINRMRSIVKGMNKDGSIISCNLYFKYRVENGVEALQQ